MEQFEQRGRTMSCCALEPWVLPFCLLLPCPVSPVDYASGVNSSRVFAFLVARSVE